MSNQNNRKNLLDIEENIQNYIFTIRNKLVMLDRDLAELYEVETKVLNQAVKRNIKRFPEHFRFQLTDDEYKNLRSQFVTSSSGHGGRRHLPFVFTEQGVSINEPTPVCVQRSMCILLIPPSK